MSPESTARFSVGLLLVLGLAGGVARAEDSGVTTEVEAPASEASANESAPVVPESPMPAPADATTTDLPGDLVAELQGTSSVPQVLTPARLVQAQVDVAASVTVLDRDMIAALGARDVPELLRLVPGMMVTNESQAGHTFAVNYHGTNLSDIRRLQVLVDGMSVIQPGLARILWNELALSIDDIERIEVTRGPNAAAYGANSFSGVVNIITTHPQDVTSNMVRVAGGNRDTIDGGARLAGHGEASDWRLSFSAKSDSGFDHTRRDAEVLDDRRVGTVNWRSEYRPTANDRVEVQFGASDTDKEVEADDFGLFSRYEDNPMVFVQNLNLLGRWSRDLSPDHEIQVQAYSEWTDIHSPFRSCLDPILLSDELAAMSAAFPKEAQGLLEEAGGGDGDPDGDGPAQPDGIDGDVGAFIGAMQPGPQAAAMDVINTYMTFQGNGFTETCGDVDLDIRESRIDFEVQDTLRVNERLRVVSGFSYRRDVASSASYTGGQISNEILRLFAHSEYRPFDTLLFNLGAMLEKDEISGSSLSPRAGINWRLRDQQSLRLVSSRAFRTQDLYEEFAETRITFRNLDPVYDDGVNPPSTQRDLFLIQQAPGNLDPEEINSLELGYFGYFADLRTEVDVRVFREHLRKLISDAINPFDFETDNKSQTDLTGVEWQAKRTLAPGSWLWASYAYIDNDSTHPIEQKFTALHSGSLAVAQRFSPRWSGSAAFYVSRDQNAKPRVPDGYNFRRLDLRVAHNAPLGGATLQLSANAQYRFDDKPHIHDDNNYDDRLYGYFGLQLNF